MGINTCGCCEATGRLSRKVTALGGSDASSPDEERSKDSSLLPVLLALEVDMIPKIQCRANFCLPYRQSAQCRVAADNLCLGMVYAEGVWIT